MWILLAFIECFACIYITQMQDSHPIHQYYTNPPFSYVLQNYEKKSSKVMEKPSYEEGVDPGTGSSASPRRRILCRYEAQARVKRISLVRRGEGCFVTAKPKPEQRGTPRFIEAKANLHRGEEVRRVEGRTLQKQLSGLPQWRSLRRGEECRAGITNLAFLADLWPIFHFPINICILDLMRVRFLGGRTPLGFFLSSS